MNVSLDSGDAMELGQLLQFLDDWLSANRVRFSESLTRFVGCESYDLESLRSDLARFMFLLGESDGEDSSRRPAPPSSPAAPAAPPWIADRAGSGTQRYAAGPGRRLRAVTSSVSPHEGLNLMDNELQFAADLYHGAAGYYDSYRLRYPDAMIEYVTGQAVIDGQGRLLDLACGTGQLTFPLHQRFSEVWAVDREPDMVEAVQAKADAMEAGNIRTVTADAETLDAPPEYFELAVIGNAFHRLRRDLIAGRLLGWLSPGGWVALCWSDAPQSGNEEWQRAFADLLGKWRRRLGAEHRIPANWEEPQRRRPDHQVLSEVGFEMAGRWELTVKHRWSLPELAGWIRSTSFLPAPVLAGHGTAFDADLDGTLGPFTDDGTVHQAVSFVCEMGRKPAAG